MIYARSESLGMKEEIREFKVSKKMFLITIILLSLSLLILFRFLLKIYLFELYYLTTKTPIIVRHVYFIISFFEIIGLTIIDNSIIIKIYNSVTSCQGFNNISRFFFMGIRESRQLKSRLISSKMRHLKRLARYSTK